MAIADKLTKLENDISDAYTEISNKNGTIPENKNTANLPSAIASIPGGISPTGTKYISENGRYNVSSYEWANVNVHSFPPNWYDIGLADTPSDILESFNDAYQLQEQWNTGPDAELTDYFRKFADSSMKYLPALLFSSYQISSTQEFCRNCGELTSVAFIGLSFNENGNGGARNMFADCLELRDVDGFMFNNVMSLSGMFSNCPKLTSASLQNILQSLTNCATTDSNPMFPSSEKSLMNIGFDGDQINYCLNELSDTWDMLANDGWIPA